MTDYWPTKRERDVIAAIIECGTIERAAVMLNISTNTVDRHLDNIRKKSRLRYLPQITAQATKQGWLTA